MKFFSFSHALSLLALLAASVCFPGCDVKPGEAPKKPVTPAAPVAPTVSLPVIADRRAPLTEGSRWIAGAGSELCLTTDRFKLAKESTLWSWSEPSGAATFRLENNPNTSKTSRNDTTAFGAWVYNETPVAAAMRAELLHGDEVVASFWFWMDYMGWRPLGAPFKEVGCKLNQAVDGLRLHAPEGTSAGRLFLDGAQFAAQGDWHIDRAGTYQMPWIAHPGALKNMPSVVLSDSDIRLNRPWLPARKAQADITAQERADMAKLAERLLPALTRPGKGLKPESLIPLREQMKKYQIVRKNGIVTGRPLGTDIFLSPPDAENEWKYLSFCEEVQRAYAQANTPEHKAELKQMFVDLAAHWLDQGRALGMPRHPVNYPGAGLNGFLAMRDVLAEAGLAREMALSLAEDLGCQTYGQYLAETPWASMDGIGSWNANLMACLLLLPDEAERLQHLRTVQRFFSLALLNPKTLGPDGCCYHHGGFHFAYASYCLPGVFEMVAKLADTDFRISDETLDRLKTYVRTIVFTLTDGEQPYNIVPRCGDPLRGNVLGPATTLARMGTTGRKEDLNREMAALCLNQLDANGKTREPYKSWAAQGIAPVPQTGHLTLNGGPVAIHRRDDWSVNIGGLSPFYNCVEIYGWLQGNNYGRYARNASICVASSGSPTSVEAGGWRKEGWDWFHFPGATNTLRAQQQDIFDGGGGYGGGGAGTGGTSLDADGIWGMDFKGGADNNTFKRSIFCFGNRVTSLTTDITGTTSDPMATTLFQNALAQGTEALWLDAEKVAAFPFQTRISGDKTHWLIDNKGTGYFIPAGHDPITVTTRRQEWTYMIEKCLIDKNNNPLPKHDQVNAYASFGPAQRKLVSEYVKCYKPSSGDFALAWFDHGPKPAGKACAYTMLIRTTPPEMMAFAANPPQKILARDAKVHALFDAQTRTTGYVLFAANEAIAAEGLLLSNSRPCHVMVRSAGTDLRVSVACPDILNKEPIRLKLKGAWKVATPAIATLTVTPDGNDTRVEVQPDYYMPMRFSLKAGR